jgi:hypothetical protein
MPRHDHTTLKPLSHFRDLMVTLPGPYLAVSHYRDEPFEAAATLVGHACARFHIRVLVFSHVLYIPKVTIRLFCRPFWLLV